MKKGIHPEYTPLKIKIGKEEFLTNSAYRGDEYVMDIDFRTHPAWNKEAVSTANQANKSIRSFNDKFAGLTFGGKKKQG